MVICQHYNVKVDIVPSTATFRSKTAKPPKDRFMCNPRGRKVVRMIKDKYPKRWPGETIELVVLNVQREHAKIKNVELFDRTIRKLRA